MGVLNVNAPVLRVEKVTKRFGELVALQSVNFELQRGQNQAIIGPNGAGKTTLFNVITGEFPPSEGRVWFQGHDITGLPPYHIAQHGLARSFQLNNLFPDFTAYDNVWLAVQIRHPWRESMFRNTRRLPELDEQVWRVLEQVHLEAVALQRACELSYGDQRHLEIGLALATQPQLLLLDEPTSGISPAETQKTIELIQSISKEVTLLLIEHDMDVVMSVADRILVMHYGSVLAQGTPEQVEANPEVQEAYLGDFR